MRLPDRVLAFFIAAGFWMITATPAQTATLLYKSYVVRKDRGRDILCDPYIVQSNDSILKLFRARGEIAQTDLPEFLFIFSRLNPQVRNVDRIQPGEHVFIPLKKLAPNSLPDQQSGFVTIPFVSLATIPNALKKHAREYTVKPGDTVIDLLSNTFGKYGTKAHQDGLRLFGRLNPRIADPNHIVTGQSVWLPNADLLNQPVYASLFDAAGNMIADPSFPSEQPTHYQAVSDTRTPLQQVADLLEAQLIDKGTYYFPRPDNSDVTLNLARYPVLEFSDHRRVMFAPAATTLPAMSESDMAAVTSFWKNLTVVTLDADATPEQLLNAYFKTGTEKEDKGEISLLDNGVHIAIKARWWFEPPQLNTDQPLTTGRKIGILSLNEKAHTIPNTLLTYLEKHGICLKSITSALPCKNDGEHQAPTLTQEKIIETSPPERFVSSLLSSLNISYSPHVAISFPYSGMQIPAVSNLIDTANGRSLLIDFGSLYGEAVTAIETSGLKVIRLSAEDTSRDIIEKLLTGIGLSFQTDPHFSATPEPAAFGAEFSIPGYLVSLPASSEAFFSMVPLDPLLVQFFIDRGLDIFQIASPFTESQPYRTEE
ncbi:MAG: hypothetical protein RBT11_02535 [Desulfobacterales bacterium]|jgi:hypothetical protein|nr:hypothetical protein [Desulfobacterales bacterium]